jgi:hypothetical protein
MIQLPPPEFEVNYRAFSFPTGVIDGGGKLSFTTDDLAHALMTTGRAPGDRGRYGWASAYEWMHRASLIPAYLRRTYHGRLVRSRLASELDRSELVGLSYALGQAMTALFCRKELAVTHLLHIDRYADQYRLRFGGRKRADLFGIARQGWVVAEAKGRSRAMEPSLRAKLVAQKRSVLSIADDEPWLALDCVASFPLLNGGMEIDAFDPEEAAREAITITANLDQFMLAYYLPFITAIDLGQATAGGVNRPAEDVAGGNDVVTTGSLAPGLRVGVLSAVYNRVRRAIDGQVDGLGEEIRATLLEDEATTDLNLFPDGTAVTTDWASAVAAQDWAE